MGCLRARVAWLAGTEVARLWTRDGIPLVDSHVGIIPVDVGEVPSKQSIQSTEAVGARNRVGAHTAAKLFLVH